MIIHFPCLFRTSYIPNRLYVIWRVSHTDAIARLSSLSNQTCSIPFPTEKILSNLIMPDLSTVSFDGSLRYLTKTSLTFLILTIKIWFFTIWKIIVLNLGICNSSFQSYSNRLIDLYESLNGMQKLTKVQTRNRGGSYVCKPDTAGLHKPDNDVYYCGDRNSSTLTTPQ